MKRCSQCSREIPDSATTCDQCDSLGALDLESLDLPIDAVAPEAAAPVNAAPPTVAPALAAPAATAPSARPTTTAGSGNRRMLIAGLLVVAGGTLTFAMFRSSAAPATPVSSSTAAKPAASKPAAPKPNAPRPVAPNATSAPAATASPAATAAPAAAPSGAVVPVSTWSPANREWLLNAKKGAAFELRSDNRVAIWQGIAQPMLVIRCDAGKMQTFVYTASAIQMEAQDENHTVRVSFDGEPESTERWADSAEHDALFAPDGVAFAHRLSTAQTLRVSYTPHNAPRAVAHFQVAGLAETLHPAAKQCGWK